MKKKCQLLFTLLFVLGFCFPIYANVANATAGINENLQNKKITGTVVDSGDTPIVGASILIKGTSSGTITNKDGIFTLNVATQGSILVVSYVGYTTREITIGASSSYRIILTEDTQTLDEIVVTAMGIKKERKALGYSVQDIKSDELLKNKTANPINALSGKIAGVNVTQSSGAAGSGAQVILRGGTSLERDNQPLFVVDGIIYDNSTSVNGDSAFDGITATATTNSNRVMDINPEDIENMSILKGPAAAALYGSRAAAGVIIITTKKGKEGSVQVNVNSKFSANWINRLPEQQSIYKRGYYDGNNFNDLSMKSWGEKFEAGEEKYNNINQFFQNSHIWDNSVSISGGSKNGTFYLSASRLDQSGIIPTTGYDKTTFRLNGEQKYGNLTVGANVAYSQAHTDKTLTSAGLWITGGDGTMNSLYRWPRNDNMKHYLNDDGSKYRMFEGRQDLADDIENPYWIINKNKMTDMTERITGNANASYKITDWWDISYRAGIDSYNTSNYSLTQPGSAVKILYQKGMMSENELKYMYMSSNLMTNLHKNFKDFNLNLLLGTITEDTKTTTNRRMGWSFEQEDFFSFSNIINSNKQFQEMHNRKRMVSGYGEFRIDYKNLAYLTVTGRNDWTSTLPIDNRSYFYPSVGGSFIFSELLPDNKIISFGKIRASWARVGKDAAAYATNTYLWPSREFLGGIVGTGNSWTRGNPYLKPETTESTELGLEMRFLKGRIGFDFTYYTNNSFDQILSPRLSQTTGYIFCSINAGDIYNKGMELSITGQPIKTRDFVWDATLNIAGNRGTVKNLLEGVQILYVTDVQVGSAKAASFNNGHFMAISGSKWNRTKDGKVILNEYGMPTSDNKTTYEIGNREPKFTGGFNNSLQYKNWNLSFLFDFRVGGHVYNGTDYYMTVNGTSKRSENRGKITTTGVVNTGTEKEPVYVEKSFTFEADKSYNINGTMTSGLNIIQNYYGDYFTRESANFMVKTNWLRLRSVSLTYDLPKAWLNKSKIIKGCLMTLSGNNLLLFTNYKGMDPEASAAGSGATGSSSVGIDYCGVPATAGMSFGINLTF